MKTYLFNGGVYSTTSDKVYNVGDLIKVCDNANVGKDGKPTLKLVKVLSVTKLNDMIYQGDCLLQSQPSTSNIIAYDYVLFKTQPSDRFDKRVNDTINRDSLAVCMIYQSSGARKENGESMSLAEQVKENKATAVYIYLDMKDNLSSNITRVHGTTFEQSNMKDRNDFIDSLLKLGFHLVDLTK